MALTFEERQDRCLARSWKFDSKERVAIIRLGMADGKTFAEAKIFADAHTSKFVGRDDVARARFARMVDVGQGGVLDQLVTSTNMFRKFDDGDISEPKFEIFLFLLADGETVEVAHADAKALSGGKAKLEEILYELESTDGLSLADAVALVGA